jgi:hypothetical protein
MFHYISFYFVILDFQHEVERLKQTAQAIKASVEHHKQWLDSYELSLIAHLKKAYEDRFVVETSQVACVLKLIGKCIENCEPIREEWLLAPDVVCVCKNRLVVPPPLDPIVPDVIQFSANRLNGQQSEYLLECLTTSGPAIVSATNIGSPTSTGPKSSGVTVIEQDMMCVLNRLLSNAGPLAHMTTPTNTLLALTLPKNWRKPPGSAETVPILADPAAVLRFGAFYL